MRARLTIVTLAAAVAFGVICIHNAPDESLTAPGSRTPGAYKALADLQAARLHGTDPDDPGAFFRGFEHAKMMTKAGNAANHATWQALGPTNWGGRTLALAIDPRAPDTIFAGAASGGLWRSDSGGQGEAAWSMVDTGYPVLGVAAIAIDPSDSETILIGTGEVYSYQTGIPSVGERIMRGSFGIGVLKSTDGGATWAPSLDWRYDQRTGVQAIEFDPFEPTVVWAATTEGVYRSTDTGATWERSLDVVMATDIVINTNDTDRLIVACGGLRSPGYGLYRTVDGGLSWTKMTENLPASFGGKAMLGVSESTPDTVYATFGPHPLHSFATSHLARSDDFGATWSIVSDENFARYQGFYSHFVGVHPDDPEAVLVGGVEMWHSTDGGSTLEMMDLVVTDNDIIDTMTLLDGWWVEIWGDNHAMEFHPSNPDIYYVACDQGIFRTTDAGATFQRSVGGYQTAQFYDGMAQSQTEKDLLWGSIQDWCGVGYTGSESWYLDDLLFEGGRMEIDPSDEQTRYSSYYYLDWMLRNDHGELFDITPPARNSASFCAPFVLSPSDPHILYAGKDIVFKSNDRGETWTATGNGAPLSADPQNPTLSMAVSSYDSDRVYVSTAPYLTGRAPHERTHVYRTTDGGQTWQDITGSLPDRFVMDIMVHPDDHDQVFLALSGFGSSHVFGSRDGGSSWDDLDRGELPDVPTSALAFDPDNPERLFVGNDIGVFASPDRGASWFSLRSGLPSAVMVFDLLVYAPDRILRAGTHGNGVYELPIPDRIGPDPDAPRHPDGRAPQ